MESQINVHDFEKFGIGAEDIKNIDAFNKIPKNEKRDHNISGLFEIAPANDVIEQALQMPDPVYLYPVLILEKEFIILFADTGIGKTVLAYQTAVHIAKMGKNVLYLDLELSKKQFQKRFTGEDGIPYVLPDKLYRANFSRLKKLPQDKSYEEYFFESLIPLLIKYKVEVLYLDNLTKLAAGDTDTAKASIPILERLNELKDEFDLTIIVLEHNKKVDHSRPIQLNDLQGSKMKSNLVDSVFTIGRVESDKYLRYIKQVKVRDGEVVYDTENVLVCELSKKDGFLSFSIIGNDNEYALLRSDTHEDKEVRRQNAKELKEKGYSNRQIAKDLGVSEGAVRKWFKS